MEDAETVEVVRKSGPRPQTPIIPHPQAESEVVLYRRRGIATELGNERWGEHVIELPEGILEVLGNVDPAGRSRIDGRRDLVLDAGRRLLCAEGANRWKKEREGEGETRSNGRRPHRKCFQLAPAKRRATNRRKDPRTGKCWTSATTVGMAQATSVRRTPSLRWRRIWTAATQTITPARTLTPMNNSPVPDEIAGIPMAKAARIVRTPTTQQSVEAIRTPVGAFAG